ncbi:MAG: echA, partial [Mycobacterium sp.]|nr:echA [Mycobacterium sp.]
AKVYFGEAALAAGWIDEIALPEAVLERAEESARAFAKLHRGAHAASKLRARAEALDGIRAGIDNMRAEFGLK